MKNTKNMMREEWKKREKELVEERKVNLENLRIERDSEIEGGGERFGWNKMKEGEEREKNVDGRRGKTREKREGYPIRGRELEKRKLYEIKEQQRKKKKSKRR